MDLGWSVLIIVAVILAYYGYRSNTLRRRAGNELRELLPAFTADIETRAVRGQDPDWLRYSEESDRQHEDTCERIRNYATTALATGIGGTMLILMLHLGAGSESTDAVRSLLQEMGLALVASLLGVMCNLVILLAILPGASNQFRSEREGFIRTLRGVSETNPPRTPSTNLGDAVSDKLDQFLQNTASNLPEVIAGFRDSVGSLDGIASDFKTSAEQMESSTGALASSIASLDGFPKNLGQELARARQEWISDLQKKQELHLEAFGKALSEQAENVEKTLADMREWDENRAKAESEWREQRSEEERRHRSALAELLKASTVEQSEAVRKVMATLDEWQATRTEAEERWLEQQAMDRERQRQSLRQVVSATGDVASAAERLPRAFSEEILRASDTLGKRFGLEARQQVADVIDATQKGNVELREHLESHVRQLVNEMGDIVHQGLKPTEEGISKIGRNLEAAGEDLRKSVKEFADHGQNFRASLDGAARGIDASTEQLAGVHEKTQVSIAQIQEEYRMMHITLGKSIEKTESLLRELSIASGQARQGGFLSRIFGLGKRPGRGRRGQ